MCLSLIFRVSHKSTFLMNLFIWGCGGKDEISRKNPYNETLQGLCLQRLCIVTIFYQKSRQYMR